MNNSQILYRNHSIEALRFFFMLLICCWHNYASSGVFRHGYLAVEFFFILSGYLLYKSFSKQNSLSTIDYTLKKIKRFAPEYLIVMIFLYMRHFLIPCILGKREFSVPLVLKMFPEMVFLQDSGLYYGGMNFPLWYLSILLVGGGLLYALLKYDQRLALNIVFPWLCLQGYVYIFSNSPDGSIQVWGANGASVMKLLRGVAGMSLGVLLAYFFTRKQEKLKKHCIWLSIVGGDVLLCIFLLFFPDHILTDMHYYLSRQLSLCVS